MSQDCVFDTDTVISADLVLAAEPLAASTGAALQTSNPSSNDPIWTAVAALLTTSTWSQTVISYGFPTSASFYSAAATSNDEETGFLALSSYGQAMMRKAFSQWDGLINVTLVENTSSPNIAVSGSSVPSTAWAYLPGSGEGGDIWVGSTSSSNSLFFTSTDTAYIGSYAYYVALHEIGHALGLKHPHAAGGGNSAIMSTTYDSIELTVMSYRSYLGGGVGSLTPKAGHFPQSLMMLDIAAIQELYGADYSTNATDTVYTFSTTTGEMFINGVSTGTTAANVVFRTLWDGNGTDLIDLSNYSTSMAVDLNSGGSIVLDTVGYTQRANLLNSVNPVYATANIYMSLLYNDDVRSLIENVTTGAGNDTIKGNQANNVITAGAGVNTIDGGAGQDTVVLAADASAIQVNYSTGSDTMVFTFGSTNTSITNVETVKTTNSSFSVATLIANWSQFSGATTVSLANLAAPSSTVTNDAVLVNGLGYQVASYTSPYAQWQDKGTATISQDSSSIALGSNAIKIITMPVTVTADTVLTFDYSALIEGEIQGIGFIKNGSLSGSTIFQLDGTQAFGLTAFKNTYSVGSGTQHYSIQLADYIWTGTYDGIVLLADDDAGVGATATFSNITLTEGVATSPTSLHVSGTGYEVVAYNSPYAQWQDKGTATISSDNSSITLSSNAIKVIDMPLTVTADTVLTFDYSALIEGEIQGIGFLKNGTLSGSTVFQLDGTQAFGLTAFQNTYTVGSGTQHYSIKLSDYIWTGAYDGIVLLADDDAGVGATATFSNITLSTVTTGTDTTVSTDLSMLVSGASHTVVAYDSPYAQWQDKGTATVSSDQTSITLTSNAIKIIEMGITVGTDTILSFDYSAFVEGEIQGIGLLKNGSLSGSTIFQLDGTQAFGLTAFQDDYAVNTGTQHYSIKLSDYIWTGAYDGIVLLADDDAGVGADATFANIMIA